MICKLFPVFSRVPSSNRFQMKAFNWCRYQGQGQRRGKPGICKTSFAQWRYSKQWSNRELLLLLVENYTQYPALLVWKTTCWGNFWRLSWEQIDVRRTSVLGNMTLVLCDSGTAAWTEQIYKLRWFHTCVSRKLSFDKAFTACSISASGVYLLDLSGIFLLIAKANDGFLNQRNQVTVARWPYVPYDQCPLVTLLFSRTAAWTEQFHKLRWVQTCVAHS